MASPGDAKPSAPASAWGKWRDPQSYHRLEHHCADVAAVFEALLQQPTIAVRLTRLSGRGPVDATTAARLTCLVFLHDFGKLNAGFQFKVLDPRPRRAPHPAGHVAPAARALEGAAPEVCTALGFADLAGWGAATEPLLLAALAHHGRPAPLLSTVGQLPSDRERATWGRVDTPHYDPAEQAALYAACMRRWFPEAFAPGPDLPDAPAFQHLFAGLVALADWIGSDETLFPFVAAETSDYVTRARARAQAAIAALDLAPGPRHMAAPLDFERIFGFAPNAMQQAIGGIGLDEQLVILESETGSGKTEAAFRRFADLYAAGRVDALYFAVPTRAAAVQLHRRIHRAAVAWLGTAAPETVLAVPGYLKAGLTEGRPLPDWQVLWDDDPDSATRARRWAAENAKRYLAAPMAVGTVDQAMLAGLMVKHAHLRAASLARSLLVVDEVHASDPWMRAILGRVVDNHLQAGGHALLMSATLGSSLREHWRGSGRLSRSQAEETPYPAIATRRGIERVDHDGRDKPVRLSLATDMEDAPAVAARAVALARRDAKVLVIRNTVALALATQQALEVALDGAAGTLLFACEGVPTLHHGRFAAEDRRLLDHAVERVLGRRRPAGGAIVVGTQTLEQSLDIDADVLITDLCPVDVLLQRLGRLHRHCRDDRPDGVREPAATVLAPPGDLASLLERGRHGLGLMRDRGIYPDLRVVEATRRLIAAEPIWRLPEMNRRLVERATHPEVLEAIAAEGGPAWQAHGRTISGIASAEGQMAGLYLLDWRRGFDDLAFPDNDETVRTRIGDEGPAIQLEDGTIGPFGRPITRIAVPHHLAPDTHGDEPVDIRRAPEAEALRIRLGERSFIYDRLGLRGEA